MQIYWLLPRRKRAAHYAQTIAHIEALELRNMLRRDEDKMGAILDINAGAGGTEALDWASMLLRMYTRWCEAHGYKVKTLLRLLLLVLQIHALAFDVETLLQRIPTARRLLDLFCQYHKISGLKSIGDKDTNKREQCQIYLNIAEREYLRRSQRYEKSSACKYIGFCRDENELRTSRNPAARQEGRQTTVRDRKKPMKISGISRTGRPFASSGKLRDTRMKRGDEIGRKAISFTSPDDFSEKSVSLGFERTTSNDDFSVQIRSRRQPRSHPPAPPRRHGLLRSLL